MLERLEQLLKAHSPMKVTLLGMVMLVRLAQLIKAHSPMAVTALPLIVPGMVREATFSLL